MVKITFASCGKNNFEARISLMEQSPEDMEKEDIRLTSSIKRKLFWRRVKSGCFYLISSVLSILNNVKSRCLAGPNKTYSRILLISPAHIGDFIWTSSIIKALSMVYPYIEFDVVANNDNREIASLIPNVRNVLAFNYNRGRGAGLPTGRTDWSNIKKVLKEVTSHKYDGLIIISPDTILNLLVQIFFFLKKRPIKVCDISFLNLLGLLTGTAKKTHTIDIFKQLIAPLVRDDKIPELIPFIKMPETNETQYRPHLNDKLIIGFCVGAGWKYKKWNRTHFLKVANLILQEYKNATITVYGYDSEDAEAANFIKKNCTCPEKVETFINKEMLDFLKSLQQCNLVISNDSGPAHIAGALGVPLIVIFGPVDPARATPRGTSTVKVYRNRVECSPCSQTGCFNSVKRKCMDSVLPGEVFEGVKEVIQGLHT